MSKIGSGKNLQILELKKWLEMPEKVRRIVNGIIIFVGFMTKRLVNVHLKIVQLYTTKI